MVWTQNIPTNHRDILKRLNVHNEWIVEELNKPENSLWLEKTLICRILASAKG